MLVNCLSPLTLHYSVRYIPVGYKPTSPPSPFLPCITQFVLCQLAINPVHPLLPSFSPTKSWLSSNVDHQRVTTQDAPQWFRNAENWDGNLGPLACPFAHSLALHSYFLALHCLLCSHALLRSLFACMLTHSLNHSHAHSLTRSFLSSWGSVFLNVSNSDCCEP